jgi:WS/DGAT/MGAT family acyltransferase
VAGALRSHFLAHGYDTDVELKAMVPVSVRAESERGALGNRVAAMYAPLPIGLEDPIARFRAVHEAMRGLKESGQAVGAETLTALADFAPPTILSQAARIQAVQRFFNLTVTNVPGPQFALYLLGRQLARLYPLVPIVENAALGIAIMSYNGRIDFGLVSDYDALPDLDDLAAALEGAIAELAAVAGVAGKPRPRRTRAKQHA